MSASTGSRLRPWGKPRIPQDRTGLPRKARLHTSHTPDTPLFSMYGVVCN